MQIVFLLLLVLLLLLEAIKNRSKSLGWISRALQADIFWCMKVVYKDLANWQLLGGIVVLVTALVDHLVLLLLWFVQGVKISQAVQLFSGGG